MSLMLLFHDLPEIRIGDINKLQSYYTTYDEESAIKDQVAGLSFGKDIAEYLTEFNQKQTKEAIIAHDADALALLVRLKELVDKGDEQAVFWFKGNQDRLKSKTAKQLAKAVWETDSQEWWHDIRKKLHKDYIQENA